MKNALRVFVPVLFSILAFGASAPSAFAETPTLNVYQTTLGSPSGTPQGNVLVAGSAAPFLAARDAAIADTLVNKTTYTPQEASIWGVGGTFGSELYMLSVVRNLPEGSLLKVTKVIDSFDPETEDWTNAFTWTNYYPMEVYTHTTATDANNYLTKFDCSAGLCTYVTSAGVGDEFDTSVHTAAIDGTANNPPSEIVKAIGFQLRQTLTVGVITGSWALAGETLNFRGYRMGSGYTGGDPIQNLETLINTSSVPQPTTIYIDPTYSTSSCGGHECYYDAFPTIQAGVDAVAVDGTVHVAAGTYAEQLTINKNLTIIGAGDTTIVQSPDTLTSTFDKSGNPMKPVITIKDGAIANISALKVDGAAKGNNTTNTFFVGIGLYNAGGTLDHVTVTGVKETTPNRDQQGEGIVALNTDSASRTLSIASSTVSDFQKNGITLSGSGLTVTVSGNTVTGTGANNLVAQNGIHIGTGVTGSVTGNTVSELRCADSTCGNDWATKYQAMAIVVAGAVGPITVSGNTVSNSDVGIYSELTSGVATITNNILTGNRWFGMLFEKGDVAVSGGSVTGGEIGIFTPSDHQGGNTAVHNVNISGNSIAGLKNDVALSINATNNWWGSESSPDGVFIDGTSTSTVSYSPWYTNVGMTTLSNSTVVPDESGNATVDSTTPEVVITNPDQALTVTVPSDVADPTINFDALVTDGIGTLPETTINSTVGSVAIEVVIPDNTVVTSSDSSWNGVMTLPQPDTGSTSNPPAGFSVGDVKIEVGSPDFTLSFDKAVSITLTGVTGTVGYRPAGSDVWQTIETQCNSATNHDNINVSSPKECYFHEGGNTIIWTYHFTSFGGLDPIPDEVTPPSSSHGGGNTCGNGFTFNPSTLGCDRRATPATPAVPGVSPAVPATPAQGRGQVLGAATFNFTKSLTVGSRGADVNALQQFLIDGGYGIPSGATGYFGKETRAAVIAFQKARGIAQVGNVGPLTRAELNKGTMPTTAESAHTNLTNAQASAILSIIESFGADASVVARVKASLGL